MKGMDSMELLNDISKRCGLDIEIIRRVQNAETEYIIDRLKRGERVRIPGRGTFRPELRNRLGIGGNLEQQINVKFSISDVIKNSLSECNGFDDKADKEDDTIPDNIRTIQIESLL